jgi:hypothetical protein
MLSTKVMPEVVEYPEAGKVCVLTRPPFAPREPGEDPADRLMLAVRRRTPSSSQRLLPDV